MNPSSFLSVAQVAQFHAQGFLRLSADSASLLTPEQVAHLRTLALSHLEQRIEPFELEAATGYPGAPSSCDAQGGETIRRLLGAYDRHPDFAAWAGRTEIIQSLHALLGGAPILARAHHNCVMTKQPAFSSQTNWHQDIRYWSFTDSELISVWLALGEETVDNGCLWVLPGSHHWALDPTQLDERKFLRADLAQNQALLAGAIPVPLAAGEVLLFHARTFHAARHNATQQLKCALVFTYHGPQTHPLPNTRSALQAEVGFQLATSVLD